LLADTAESLEYRSMFYVIQGGIRSVNIYCLLYNESLTFFSRMHRVLSL